MSTKQSSTSIGQPVRELPVTDVEARSSTIGMHSALRLAGSIRAQRLGPCHADT